MAEEQRRRCMQTLAEWGLFDVSDGYDKARLVSVDEESDSARQLKTGRNERHHAAHGLVTADMIEQVEYHG